MSRSSIDDLRLTIDDWSRSTRTRGVARGKFQSQSSASKRQSRSAFTLIETALATIIVGVGVLAIVAAQQAFHKQNAWSTHASTATRLGNEIREMTLNLPRHDPVTGTANWGPEGNETWVGAYDDLDDFDGEEGAGILFSADVNPPNGPINARREVIPNMAGWSQVVRVYNVSPNDITSPQPDASTNTMMVEVTVFHQGPNDQSPVEMTKVSWVAPK